MWPGNSGDIDLSLGKAQESKPCQKPHSNSGSLKAKASLGMESKPISTLLLFQNQGSPYRSPFAPNAKKNNLMLLLKGQSTTFSNAHFTLNHLGIDYLFQSLNLGIYFIIKAKLNTQPLPLFFVQPPSSLHVLAI